MPNLEGTAVAAISQSQDARDVDGAILLPVNEFVTRATRATPALRAVKSQMGPILDRARRLASGRLANVVSALLVWGVVLAWATSPACAQPNLILLISAAGDSIGGGATFYSTNQSDFTVTGSAATLRANAFGFFIDIDAPGAANLLIREYTNAVPYPNNEDAPGLSVFGNGRSCRGNACGSFRILELETSGGQIVRLWATFTHRCQCEVPLTGEIRFNSSLAPGTPLPRTLRVPEEFLTIQSALSNAQQLASDTILVDPGVYHEAVLLGSKPVRLVSAKGPSETYIVAPGSAAVTFSGTLPETVLSGFTLLDSAYGVAASSGGTVVSNAIVNCGIGINCGSGSSVVIRDNTIIRSSGGAIQLSFTTQPWIEGNLIEDNGGGIGMWVAGAPIIRNNIIRRNRADGVAMVNTYTATIIQNVIAENSGSGINWLIPGGGAGGPLVAHNTIVGNAGAGIFADGFDDLALIVNNLVVGNPALWSGSRHANPPRIEFNNVFSYSGPAYAGSISNLTGVAGNISSDPFFACTPGNDYHLLAGSRSIDAGTNDPAFLPATDGDGNPRVRAGAAANPAVVDIGAFEFNPLTPPTPCLFLSCPSNTTVVATAGATSAVVTYAPALATPGAVVSSVPASGSSFPAGTNVVTSTATYGTNVLQCTFAIIVLVPPALVTPPQSLTVPAGTPTNYSVTATGTLPLHYQWMFEGVPIGGATTATLTFTNPQAQAEGVYTVRITNVAGSVVSAPVLLRVMPAAPSLVSGPTSLTVSAGTRVTLDVTAVGSSPLTFHWFHEGMLVAIAASSQLVISNAQAHHGGTYQVVVSNLLGPVTSSNAVLNVLPAVPAFTVQPTGASGLPTGSDFTLRALAAGTEPIVYQWRRNGIPVPGATQSTLTLSNLNSSITGTYHVTASNSLGGAVSQAAAVSISGTPLIFLQQPASIEVLEGSTVTFNSLANGILPRYQWFFQASPLPGKTNPTLVLPAVSLASVGAYFVVASNANGRGTSVVAQLTVNQSLRLLQPVSNTVADAGSTVVLSVDVFSDGPRTFAWHWNTTSLASSNESLVLSNIQPAQAGYYRVVITNRYGSISSTGRVSVLGPRFHVRAWGDNSGGQTNAPLNLTDVVAVAGGDTHSLALRHDGSIVAWGYNGSGQTNPPPPARRWVSIASGADHNLAMAEDGSLAAWGRDDFGQATLPGSVPAPVKVVAGDSHSLALLASGAVVAWGDNFFGQTAIPPGAGGLRDIAAGRHHNLALRNNGTLLGWGLNSYGQAAPPPGLANVKAIAAGYLHSVALQSNGVVVAWGDNTFGQTNVPTSISNGVAIAAGDFHTLVLRADGSIGAWGNNQFGQTDVPAVTSARALAAGSYHGLALLSGSHLEWARQANGFVLRWIGNGGLESSPDVTGPFTIIPGAVGVYTNLDFSTPARFFRIR